MNYYNEIKSKLIDDEIYSKVKDYSKENHTLITHYEVGKLLLEAVVLMEKILLVIILIS